MKPVRDMWEKLPRLKKRKKKKKKEKEKEKKKPGQDL